MEGEGCRSAWRHLCGRSVRCDFWGDGHDSLYGGWCNDVQNGGFGFDRMNVGARSGTFFNQGVAGDASDRIQDYTVEGKLLTLGLAGASQA